MTDRDLDRMRSDREIAQMLQEIHEQPFGIDPALKLRICPLPREELSVLPVWQGTEIEKWKAKRHYALKYGIVPDYCASPVKAIRK